jgi:farnesyl diphosphate synthase
MIPPPIREKILGMSQKYSQGLISDLLEYNLAGGKEFRLKAYTHAFKALGGAESYQSTATGYNLELLQALFIIIDDVMDNSEHRRGRPCFYLRRGMAAVKDAYYLLAVVRKLESSAVGGLCAGQILKASFGQTHDSLRKTRDGFRMEEYYRICDSKSGSYTLYMPAAFAYLESRTAIPEYLEEFCRIGGVLFQIQDDYLNFLPGKSGKTTNDLEEGKCTWFTCEMASMDVPAVARYFDEGVVSGELLEVVGGLFPKYGRVVDEMMERMRRMIRKEDEKALEMLLKLLSARKHHD